MSAAAIDTLLGELAERCARALKARPDINRLPGVYAGWDGRFVKIGVAGGEGGLRARAKAYRLHNPSFRMVGFRPATRGEVTCYEDLETQEFAIATDLLQFSINEEGRQRPSGIEWFVPSRAVVSVACGFTEAVEMAARIDVVSFEMRFRFQLSPRRRGHQVSA